MTLTTAVLLLALAAGCRKTFTQASRSQFIGHASWQDQADGTIVGSTENRTVGKLVMTCLVKLPSPTTSAVLDFRGARISFTGSNSRGGGLEIAGYLEKKQPVCVLSGTRSSREDWIELGAAEYALEFDRPTDRVTLAFTLIDTSDTGSLRIDLNRVSIRPRQPGENVSACPAAVR